MHIALPIGKHDILMGSDTPLALSTHNLNETRSKISISAESKAEADKLNCLSQTAFGVHTLECLGTNLELNG